jgi:hypothetical protein
MFAAGKSASSAAPSDPYFNQTTLLLHGDGTNGAQNNTFLDSSTNNFTITRNGNTTQGTFTPFSQAAGYWGNYFDNGTQGIFLPTSSNLDLSGDFTVEGWFFKNGTTDKVILGSDYPTRNIQIAFDQANVVGSTGIYNGSSWQVVTCSSSPNSQWFHLAFVRSGTTVTVYLNGTSQGTFTSSTNYRFTNGSIAALRGYNLGGWVGYISNFRIVNGTAVYTANFTQSTTPLTAITNTSLLTCQSSRFVDNSINNFTLTPNGTVAVQPFSPFLPTAAYSTTVNGGSGYFDGTGDYLSLASNAAFTVGTGDLTIEAWVYITSLGGGYAGILSGRVETPPNYPGLGLVTDANKFSFTILNNSAALIDTVDAPTNQWVHVVGVRSGTSAALFVNGVRKVSSTNSENGTSSAMNLGRFYPATDNYYFNGYISNARIVKGTAVYDPTQTTLTVPTAPFTNITNTSLLTNYTNAGIFDNAIKNNLETVGNAQISTSVVKYGTGSMAFDGTGDYLTAPQSPLYDFGTGDFTVEFWIYMNATTDTTFISKFASGAYAWLVQYISGTGLRFYWGNNGTLDSFVVGSWSPSTSTWYHVAVTRASGTLRLFIDGTQVGTTTNSSSYTSVTSLSIGRNADAGGIQYLNGYMDDIRITKGVARYTAAFTPPPAAFPNQ